MKIFYQRRLSKDSSQIQNKEETYPDREESQRLCQPVFVTIKLDLDVFDIATVSKEDASGNERSRATCSSWAYFRVRE